MPISELYKDRSIVPDALAFPGGGGRSGGTGVVSFQNELTTYVNTQTTIVQTDTRYVQNAVQSAMHAMSNAERRAKHWVGEYERVGRWDIGTDCVITTNTADPLQFDKENIRIMGARFDGSVTTGGAKWCYVCPADAEGIYLVESLVILYVDADIGATRARLTTYLNGSQWSILDSIDRDYAGETPLVDVKLGGTDLVPIKAGDELTIRIHISANITTDDTLLFPQSCYGRVNLARTRCEFDTNGNGDLITSPASGNNYLWNI